VAVTTTGCRGRAVRTKLRMVVDDSMMPGRLSQHTQSHITHTNAERHSHHKHNKKRASTADTEPIATGATGGGAYVRYDPPAYDPPVGTTPATSRLNTVTENTMSSVLL
jgi:hypothetical protein